MEQWASGEVLPPEYQAIAQAYGDIIDLNYDRDVRPFYEEEESNVSE